METESGDNDMELCMKPAPEELPKEDSLKINGEINGSCVEDAVSSKDSSEKTLLDNRTNGEITENEAVPSPENGDENCFTENSSQPCNMDVDSEVTNEVEPMEVNEVSEVNGDNSTSVDVISDSAKSVENVENSVSNIEESACEAALSPSASNEPEEDKVCDSKDVQVEEKSNKSSIPPRNDNHVSEPSRNTEMEDLAKLSSHGSLEITLVKTPVRPKKEESTEDRSSKHSEHMEIDLTQKTPEKGLDENDSVSEATPEKSSKKKKAPPTPSSVPPRRSSRNLNKTKSYADKDVYLDELEKKSDDSVEEVELTDPLADDRRKTPTKKTTIVVSDTKKLVEIAAGSKQPRGGKKEPTLVIIDTNSILSGKGGVPVGQPTTLSPHMSITPTNRPGFSMLPVSANFIKHKASVPQPMATPVMPPKPTILPSLTDDMYVVEAPSFIVPYVYEKPPVTPLKEFVDDLEKVVKGQEKLEKEERRKRREEREKEKAELKEEKSEEKDEEEDKDKVSEEDKALVEDKASVEEKALVEDKVSSEDKASSEDKSPSEDKASSEDKAPSEIKVEVKKSDNEEDKTDTEKEEKKSTSSKEDKEDKSDTETDEEGKDSDSSSRKDSDSVDTIDTKKKSESYFDNPLGKFFMQIGVNLVQEHVQADLLRNQKRKRDREGENCPVEVHMAINSLMRTLEFSKENNEPYKLELKKCKLCNFKTESALVMAHHLETPHMRNYVYRCNFCTLEVRSPHDILFHMEAEHNVRGRLERAPAFHQCPNCPFEDNQKGKLSRHLLSCAKKYKPERNQEPPLDWEPPAKIPRVRGPRLGGGGLGLGAYTTPPLAPRGTVPPPVGGRLPSSPGTGHSLLPRGRGRPPIYLNRSMEVTRHHTKGGIPPIRPGVVFRPSGPNAQPQVLLPSSYNLSNSQLYQNASSTAAAVAAAGATAKLLQQPSISITPLPRQQQTQHPPGGTPPIAKPGRPPGSVKTTFVICEICDGYIKDLEQLRNHMQWIHKVKIHPKMIYNRPPLNCQKCQFRFFTDQGLERHLLGSHGLVTSSMQEAANKGKDGGRCPVCGRVYQWKLLNHVARDHNMSLKPAHLSYKCTVCTATFGMYKQFENHVYSAHSVVAKRVMDKKPGAQPSTSGNSSPPTQSESLLKPLKINDEITIIPQPARAKTKTPQSASSKKS